MRMTTMPRKITAELYKERERRVLDAIALRKPDRVPILVLFGFFPGQICRYDR